MLKKLMVVDADWADVSGPHVAAREEALRELSLSSSKKKNDKPQSLKWAWHLEVGIPSVDFFQAVLPKAPIPGVVQVGAAMATGLGKTAGAGAPAGSGKAAAKAKKAPAADPRLAESARETDPEGYCEAHLKENWTLRLVCEGRFLSNPVTGPAPQAIVDLFAIAPFAPTPSAWALSIHRDRNDGKPPAIWQEGVAGMYRDGKMISAVESDGFLVQDLDPGIQTAYWGGGLRPKMRDAFKACAPGHSFKYRNKTYERLSDAEIAALLSAVPVWRNGGVGIRSGSERPRLPTLTPTPDPTHETPVYGPGAMRHPNPKPMGSAGDLGLIPAPKAASATSAAGSASAKNASPKKTAPAAKAKKGPK